MRTGPYLFICAGHSIDHIFMLLFMAVIGATAAPFWGLSYGELALLFTPATVVFGLGGPLAGWLADRWSGPGMMTVFFVGIGASSIFTGFADSPAMLGAGLFLVGAFASIYHPVRDPAHRARRRRPPRATARHQRRVRQRGHGGPHPSSCPA